MSDSPMANNIRIIEDYLLDPMMYAGPERSLEALAALRAQLTASQAREREAVDKIEQWATWDREKPMGEVGLENPDAMAERLATLTPEDLAPIQELFNRKKRERERITRLEAALAAARKALEQIAAIQTDDRDSEESCTMNAIARAARSGDSHTGGKA